MLIRAYGLHWNPDVVDWGARGAGNQGVLRGEVVKKTQKATRHTIDFWKAKAVYVLHDQFRAIYVGKADRRSLGPRLRDHLSDRFAGRWDMFSWFSLSGVATTYGRVSTPGQRQVDPGTILNTLEALAILTVDPPLNRKRESLPGALLATQVGSPHPQTVRHYLHTILQKVEAGQN